MPSFTVGHFTSYQSLVINLCSAQGRFNIHMSPPSAGLGACSLSVISVRRQCLQYSATIAPLTGGVTCVRKIMFGLPLLLELLLLQRIRVYSADKLWATPV